MVLFNGRFVLYRCALRCLSVYGTLCAFNTRVHSIDLLAWLGDKITVSNDLIISLEIIHANGLYSWLSIKRAIKPQNAWQMSASGFIVPHCYACMCTLCIVHFACIIFVPTKIE